MNTHGPTAFTMWNNEATPRNYEAVQLTDDENRHSNPARRRSQRERRTRKRRRDLARVEIEWRLEELRDELRGEKEAIVDELWVKAEEFAEDIRFAAKDREDEVHDEMGKLRMRIMGNKLVDKLRDETEEIVAEICYWSRRREARICEEMRSRFRNWLRISAREGHRRNGPRNGVCIEKAIEKTFATMEREKNYAVDKMGEAAAWAVYDMVRDVDHKFDELDREQDRALDEMDCQLGQEVSGIEQHLAECRLEGEKHSL